MTNPIHELPVRVYYEDTDAGGVVYNANYLKFMERGRTEWLRELGYEQDELIRDLGILFAVRHISIDYRKPGKFNELLTVQTQVTTLKKASIVFHQRIISQTSDVLLTDAEVKIASLEATALRPVAIPAAIHEKIQHG